MQGHIQKISFLEAEVAQLKEQAIQFKEQAVQFKERAVQFKELAVQFKEQNECLSEQNARLKEQLEWFKRQIFGQRSEKVIKNIDENQLFFEGFDVISEPPEKTQTTVTTHQRRKRSSTGKDTVSLPEDLPVETETLDIDESEKVCQTTGQPLVKIGEEVSRKLAYKPGSYFIKECIRPKYAFPKGSEEGIKTADLPESLLTRCQADESFLSYILVHKFANHLPLYRISEMLSREGIGISRQLLCKWVTRCGHALKPLYLEMKKHILESENVFVDESPVPMLSPGKGKTQQTFMWVLVGGRDGNPAYRVYNFRPDRKHQHAFELLENFRGNLHSDKYGAYEELAKKKQITWNPCFSHIRRKFFEAETGDSVFRSWVLMKIRHLFRLDKVGWARSPEERLKIRQEKAVPIINELIEQVKRRLVEGKYLPKSKFREALCYLCSLAPYMKNYTENAWARLDNNPAERAVRALALGRKNWLFIGNEDSGEATAVILSLVQTCRGLGINPFEYLQDVMCRLMSHNNQRLFELLPDTWAKNR